MKMLLQGLMKMLLQGVLANSVALSRGLADDAHLGDFL